MEASLMILLLLFLLAIGVPVAISLGFTGIIGFLLFTDFPISSLGGMFLHSIESFSLLAIPFFMLAGNFMSKGILARQLIDMVYWVFKPITGGFGLASTAGSALFSSVSGSSTATVVAMGNTIAPSMIEKGYSKEYAAATIAAGGTLGILIPPSIAMILLGVMMEYSISKLFIAGIIPGVLLTVVLGLVSYFVAKKHNFLGEKGSDFIQLIKIIIKSIPALLLPIIILGGIYTGWFTPTEAAAVSLLYALLISFFIYKDIDKKDYLKIAGEGLLATAMLFFIIIGAYIYSFVITDLRLPESIVMWIDGLNLSPISVLIVINILLILLGMFLEASSILLITVPIIWPILSQLGFSPEHIAVMIVVNLEIGLLTPPVGMNLFAIAGVINVKIENLYRSIIPYIVALLIVLAVVTYFPIISTWLPSQMK